MFRIQGDYRQNVMGYGTITGPFVDVTLPYISFYIYNDIKVQFYRQKSYNISVPIYKRYCDNSYYLTLTHSISSSWNSPVMTWNTQYSTLSNSTDNSSVTQSNSTIFSETDFFIIRSLIYFRSLPGQGDSFYTVTAKIQIMTETQQGSHTLTKNFPQYITKYDQVYFSPSYSDYSYLIIYNEFLIYHWY